MKRPVKAPTPSPFSRYPQEWFTASLSIPWQQNGPEGAFSGALRLLRNILWQRSCRVGKGRGNAPLPTTDQIPVGTAAGGLPPGLASVQAGLCPPYRPPAGFAGTTCTTRNPRAL